MKTALLALAAATLAPLVTTSFAAPPPGAGRYAGNGYVRPLPPVYRPGYPVFRPAYVGYRPGWNAGYWGPRGAVYYGGYYGRPAYWGAWPYAAAWGFGLGGYAVGYPAGYPIAYPYASVPIVVNTVSIPQVTIEQAPAPVEPQAQPSTGYWHYCAQPAGYFPYVKDCSQPWLKVIPQVPGEQATPPQLAR